MLTTAQLIEWRALTAGPDGASPSTPILAERGMLLALLDEVLAGREASRPRPITATEPPSFQSVLFGSAGFMPAQGYASGNRSICLVDRRSDMPPPTHWWPLPFMPEQELSP